MPRTIHEPLAYKISRPRSWTFWILILLIINIAGMVWFLGPWQRSTALPPTTTEPARIETSGTKADHQVMPPPANQPVQQKSDALPASQQPSAQKATEQPQTNPLPLPRNENQVYPLQQLPLAIQRAIPSLQMSLHAYNRTDTNASMVQLNNQIYHAGDQISNGLLLEKITAEGAVLRFDGYRFLLPRRGN